MYQPSRKEFLELASQGNTIPVYRTLLADYLTPVSVFSRLTSDTEEGFLLESVVGLERIARYTFVGADPKMTFRAFGNRVEITSPDGVETVEADDPLAKLEELLALRRTAHHGSLPRFTGGAVGYAGYDMVRYYEHLPNAPQDDRRLPDLHFGFYDSMVIFDHVDKTVKVISNACLRDGDANRAYDEACSRVDGMCEKLRQPVFARISDIDTGISPDVPFDSNFKREDFFDAVRAIKEYISAGDVIQAVISQRLEVSSSADPIDIYRALRVVNPSPFMFYLKTPEADLIGSSPEIMVRVEDGLMTSRPLAGTRPRGATPEEDEALEKELLADPKERAEHVMLVDLARNDIGRVARYNSVILSDLMAVERYSHVMHIVSNVTGQLQPGRSAMDALRVSVPAGTVSGAPKVRAMEIIDEFEPTKRGPYAGAVGYLDYSGNMDTCIALRTMVLCGGKIYVQAGAGIVADSVPEREYEETLNKARALLLAVQLAESGFSPTG
ncbi:MAG: anthranilate synthase component I [Phycisphaerae bacterium]|jgi:anthranilate synthase component 1|nr:anthranilate synthase component I [Phycisphaerae bacterium]